MARKNTKPLKLDDPTRRVVRRIWEEWLQPYRRSLYKALALMAVVAATTGAYPLLIDQTYQLFDTRDFAVIYMMPLLIMLVVAVKGVALYTQTMLTNRVVYGVTADMQKAMFAHLLRADLARLTREPIGTYLSRFTTDIQLVRNALSRAVTNLVRDALTIVALVGAMFYLDWLLSLIVLVIYPLAAIPIITIGQRLRRVSANTQEHIGTMTSLLNESLSGVRMVKTYRLEPYEQKRADSAFDELYRLSMRAVRGRARLEPILEILGALAVAGVIAFGGYRVATGAGSLGAFTGFVSALLIAARPVRAIGTLNTALQEGLAAIERIFSLIDDKPRIVEKPDAMPLRVTAGHVALREVRFGYEAEVSALNDFSIDVQPGETVALVGRSGAGKSTVFNLIPRLFDVQAGTVEIDGQDVRDVTLDSLRDSIALVSQDIVLFNDTIRANIAFGRPGASEEEIVEAARAAAAHDFITALPQGYDTLVGDRGIRLSGGERQRVSLARAMLKDAPILLLDEATSALDAESEGLVQAALGRLAEGRTTLVIAHRLATVRNADRIYVLEAGRVIESGTHQSLVAAGGFYAKLVRLQFRAEEADLAEPGAPKKPAATL